MTEGGEGGGGKMQETAVTLSRDDRGGRRGAQAEFSTAMPPAGPAQRALEPSGEAPWIETTWRQTTRTGCRRKGPWEERTGLGCGEREVDEVKLGAVVDACGMVLCPKKSRSLSPCASSLRGQERSTSYIYFCPPALACETVVIHPSLLRGLYAPQMLQTQKMRSGWCHGHRRGQSSLPWIL